MRFLFHISLALLPLFFFSACGGGSSVPEGFQPSIPVLEFSTISVSSGPITGGTPFLISGRGFNADTQIFMDGVPCVTLTIHNATSATCVTPPHPAGKVDIMVARGDGEVFRRIDAWEYVGPPTIASISPSGGALAGGTNVTITGTGFKDGISVAIGLGTCQSVIRLSSTLLTCVTTAHIADTVDVTVFNPDAQSAVLPDAYTYRAAPSVGSVTPSSGPLVGGTTVTISGSGFIDGASVTFGDDTCGTIDVVDPSTITCVTPAHAQGAVLVTVTNPDGQIGALSNGFTFRNSPEIATVNPIGGPLTGGTSLTITGANFVDGATVSIGSNACAVVTVVNPTTITCTSPGNAISGAVDVTVTNPDAQSATLTDGFTYRPRPTVTSISPSGGNTAGGTTVTITGTNFADGATAALGSANCASVVVVNETTITCTTTAHAAGAVNVVVTNPDTQTNLLAGGYTYSDAPVVSSVSPSGGPLAGGTAVTISGSGFGANATVTFDGDAATSVSVVNSTTITCATPAHAAGPVEVRVTNTDDQTGAKAGAFTYRDAPTVSSVSPSGGPISGGTAVTITGTGFVTGATASFGGVACASPDVVSDTEMTCTTGAHPAGAVLVTVTNPDNQQGTLSNGFTYRNAPDLISVTPSGGLASGGEELTLNGTGFVDGATVNVGGTPCASVTFVNATTLTCIAPAHAPGTVSVVVTNPDSQNDLLPNAYTYSTGPVVTSVTPNAGPLGGGALVTISGFGFVDGATVTFGGQACTGVSVPSSTSLTCTTPAHAPGTVSVEVTNPDTLSGSLAAGYTFQSEPVVSSVSPPGGPAAGGTPVTITGANFLSGATVTFGGDAATSVVVVNASTITCVTPAHALGLVDVVVTNPDAQSGTLTDGYMYNNAPTVTSVTPSSGPLAGGVGVTVNGTNFVDGAEVKFDGLAASSVVFLSDTQLSVVTPAHAAGTVSVSVTNPDTQGDTLAEAYTYRATPTVSAVTPALGRVAGGDAVTVTGEGFVDGATVDFGGSACGPVSFVDAQTLTCTTSAHAAGSVLVTVTNPDSQTGTLPNGFEYTESPVVSSVSPIGGPAAGGTDITITGSNFPASGEILIAGDACTSVVFVNASLATCITPGFAGALPATVDVVVRASPSVSGTLVDGFTYADAPTVSSVTPYGGHVDGGTSVVVAGTGFVDGASVDFGGAPCGSVEVDGPTSITCVTAAHAAGKVTVTVTNPDSQAGTLLEGYTYQNAPSITSITPSTGPLAGGTGITINGADFLAGVNVTVGSNNCDNIVFVDESTITCDTPAGSAGTVAVTVTNSDGQSDTEVAGYTYIGAPSVASVSPNGGQPEGGTEVTITGNGFSEGNEVTFGGDACGTLVVVNATTITCVTPAHLPGTVEVTVTDSFGQSSAENVAFTYRPPPSLSQISPDSGPADGGTQVAITGADLIEGATVAIGGSDCTPVTVQDASTIICTTTARAAGTVNVVVTHPDGQSDTLESAYTYVAAPTVSSVSPSAGTLDGGTAVTILGTNFASGATVTFDEAECTLVNVPDSNTITCTTPEHAAGPVTVTVTNEDGQAGSLPDAYTYQGAPTVSSVSPIGGVLTGGTAVTITGTGFIEDASVTFDGSLCTNIDVVNSTTITCFTPAHAAGLVAIVVTNPDSQNGTLPDAFTYRDPPVVTSVTPEAGSVLGGTPVTVAGSGFVDGATVDFEGASCDNVVVVTPVEITCTTTAHAAGPVTVKVTNPDSQSDQLMTAYTYQDPPTFASISPAFGPVSGDTEVTITGTNFMEGATVAFDNLACNNVVVVNDTTITCSTPAHVAAFVDVYVLNPDGQAVLRVNAFSYGDPPTISQINPNVGAVEGGTEITITGSNFVSGATVTIGLAECTGVAVPDDTMLSCTTTANAAGTYDVTVTNPDGQTVTETGGYTYQPAPSIASVSPSAGPVDRFREITITGENFDDSAEVTIGDEPCMVTSVPNPQTILCITPPQDAGTYHVTVTQAGQYDTYPNAFTYQLAPTIASVSPNGGPLDGNTSVTITGTGFLDGARVFFGYDEATFTVVNSDTSITATTPAHAAGPVSVAVVNTDGQEDQRANRYTYRGAPVVYMVSPDSGALDGGTNVTISGAGFYDGETAVDFGGSACTDVAFVNDETLTCTTTGHAAGAVTVTVTNDDFQSGSAVGAYMYRAAPTVTLVSPDSGPAAGGTSVSVFGTGFYNGASVTFGNADCVVSFVNSGRIDCTTSAHAAGSINVTVTNADGQSGVGTDAYTYIGALTITEVSPTEGPLEGGTSVTITGTGFQDGATVTFDGIDADNVSFVNATTITAKTPAHGAGPVDIVVTNPDTQEGTLTDGFTYSPEAWVAFNGPPNGRTNIQGMRAWTGSQFFVWGGYQSGAFPSSGERYDTISGFWIPMSTDGDVPPGRADHTGIWTGRELIIWGGQNGPTFYNSGAKYDPRTDTWTAMSTDNAPTGVSKHSAVWTGKHMIVFGGSRGPIEDGGGLYDPETDTWTQFTESGAPTAREGHAAVWTGSKMLIWGGNGATDYLNDGYIYDPVEDEWTTMAGSPLSKRAYMAHVWTGRELIVWGGASNAAPQFKSDGARYNLAENEWELMSNDNAPSARSAATGAVWTGREMILWGGWNGAAVGDGKRYDPVEDEWGNITSVDAPAARTLQISVWTGRDYLLFGGSGIADGARYTPPAPLTTDTWAEVTTEGAPQGRIRETMVWTGSEMIVWGGTNGWNNGPISIADGAKYDPIANSWTQISPVNEPQARYGHAGVWTGREMIVVGGTTMSAGTPSYHADGKAYDPLEDTWRDIPDAPEYFVNAEAVWTGKYIIVWGGWEPGVGYANYGAKYDPYDPSVVSWTSLSTDNAPIGRENHTLVWTGKYMIVWGGWVNGTNDTDTGGVYDPIADSWSATKVDFTTPTARHDHVAVWTGKHMLVWGGFEYEPLLAQPTNSGALYDPDADTWQATTLTGAPEARSYFTAVWTGKEMIVWGGHNINGTYYMNTGAAYDPGYGIANEGWRAISTTNAPDARQIENSVWTGKEMIVWGGVNTTDSNHLNTGGRYTP